MRLKIKNRPQRHETYIDLDLDLDADTVNIKHVSV